MRSNYVQDAYEAKLMELGHKGRWCSREVEEGKFSKDTLWELAEFETATLIVVGNHGRKGPKQDETILGSGIQYLSLNAKFPCMIIKDRKERSQKPDGCLRYGVCFDGSKKSKKALQTCLNIMRPTDKLTSITVHENGMLSDDAIKNLVKEECTKYGVTKIESIILNREGDMSTYQTIKQYLKDEAQDINKHGYIDFVAVGNQGMNFASKDSEKYLGSVANAVLRARRMNSIFVP